MVDPRTRHRVVPGDVRHAHAFTLTEIMVVIALLALLVALLLPVVTRLRDAAYRAQCASNLHQLDIALRAPAGTKAPEAIYPLPGNWLGHVMGRGATSVVICPSDDSPRTGATGLDQAFVQQWGHDNADHKTYLSDIVAGTGLADQQISWFRWDAVHRGNQLAGEADFLSKFNISSWPQLPKNIVAVSVDWSGRFAINTETGEVTVYDKWQQDRNGGGSRHFLGSDADASLSIEIGGGIYQGTIHSGRGQPANQGYNPPITIGFGGSPTSYGMNNQIAPDHDTGERIVLLDYKKSIVDRDPAGGMDDLPQYFAGRHRGYANALYVDGSVRLVSRPQLETFSPW